MLDNRKLHPPFSDLAAAGGFLTAPRPKEPVVEMIISHSPRVPRVTCYAYFWEFPAIMVPQDRWMVYTEKSHLQMDDN